MESKDASKLNITIIHPDLGIGGAKRLIVDAAVELSSKGHNVHIFASHHDKTRFEETVSDLSSLCCRSTDEVEKAFQGCHFPDFLLAQHTTVLRRIYRKPIDYLEEITTCMDDLILVNNNFIASTFAKTFKLLSSRRVSLAVLYPVVNVDQFDEPSATKLTFLSINWFEQKKNIELAIFAFYVLCNNQKEFLQGGNIKELSLVVAGGTAERERRVFRGTEKLGR